MWESKQLRMLEGKETNHKTGCGQEHHEEYKTSKREGKEAIKQVTRVFSTNKACKYSSKVQED